MSMKQITFSEERRAALVSAIQAQCSDSFDETLSDFRAEQLLDMMVALIGPGIYNQAVQDVRAHLQSRLDDLDGEVYVEPD